MWPPSSWATGRRFREVAKRPTQAARPMGWSKSVPGEMPGWSDGSEETQEQAECRRRGRRCLRSCKAGNDFRVENAVGECGNGENETDERAGSADVEECAGGANRRTNQDESAEGADERGEGNEERIAGANVMMAAGEEMAEFVGEKNGEQSEGEGEAGGEAGGMLVEKFEGANEFVEGDGLIVGVGDGELRAGDEAGAKSEEEENAGEDEQFLADGRGGTGTVIGIGGRDRRASRC